MYLYTLRVHTTHAYTHGQNVVKRRKPREKDNSNNNNKREKTSLLVGTLW
jgi:hypothetical protein